MCEESSEWYKRNETSTTVGNGLPLTTSAWPIQMFQCPLPILICTNIKLANIKHDTQKVQLNFFLVHIY